MSIGMGLRLLETLTSALYEDPIVFFREYVQNSADAFTRHPVTNARIDIKIDKKNKKIVFLDNGYGIPKKDFIDKMTSIGKSDKSKAIDQIGFRGIGRLAAMPFCKKLIFKNKVENEEEIQVFSWDGEKYNTLLSQSETDDLENAIEQITKKSVLNYDGNIFDHFFEVELVSYGAEIEELINGKDFKQKLSKLLPLKYADSFETKNDIHSHYKEFMGESLEKYEFDVYLNDEQIYKPYSDDNILESNIVFWDLSFDQFSEEVPAEKIGILWFTFNRKVSSNPTNSPRGIFVRSKNMLLGNEYAIADAISKGNNDYVTTYRELTQTLNGVYGELLIDTQRLSDNARRDWFKIDLNSNQLSVILTDFLKKLTTYRRDASAAFNDKKADSKRKKVINSYRELTGGFDTKQFEKDFYSSTSEKEEKIFQYADDDIPRYSITAKKFYDEIVIVLKEYFINTEECNGIEKFLKLRTYLKQKLNTKN